MSRLRIEYLDTLSGRGRVKKIEADLFGQPLFLKIIMDVSYVKRYRLSGWIVPPNNYRLQ